MKKLLVSIIALLIVLTACTAEGTVTEETAVPPTEISLEAAPTATDEPTVEPTATDILTATPEPEPTETAEPEPTETVEPTATAETQSNPPPEEAPSGYEGVIPDDIILPEGAVIHFTKTGGFAGFDDTWLFYEDGRVTVNGQEMTRLTSERIDLLVNNLKAQGFFETMYITDPGAFCCDFFSYTLAVQTADMQNFISFSDGDSSLPINVREMLSLMIDITDEASLQ